MRSIASALVKRYGYPLNPLPTDFKHMVDWHKSNEHIFLSVDAQKAGDKDLSQEYIQAYYDNSPISNMGVLVTKDNILKGKINDTQVIIFSSYVLNGVERAYVQGRGKVFAVNLDRITHIKSEVRRGNTEM